MSRPTAPAICGGSLRGQRLAVPAGLSVRPTRALVRQALFSMLGERVHGAEVLDLYAGSGALGLEALSRGAARTLFVESDPRALEALRRNVASCRLPSERAEVAALDVQRWAPPPARRFDVVLADPPYALLRPLPDALAAPGVLSERAVLLLEGPQARIAPRRLLGLPLQRERVHGETRLALYATSE
jgi:16S rRNA (guanine966-N2)-methyltransferase